MTSSGSGLVSSWEFGRAPTAGDHGLDLGADGKLARDVDDVGDNGQRRAFERVPMARRDA